MESYIQQSSLKTKTLIIGTLKELKIYGLPVAQGFIDGDGKLVHLYENNGSFLLSLLKIKRSIFKKENIS